MCDACGESTRMTTIIESFPTNGPKPSELRLPAWTSTKIDRQRLPSRPRSSSTASSTRRKAPASARQSRPALSRMVSKIRRAPNVRFGPSHPLVPRTDSSFVIFALKRIIKYLVDSCRGIVPMAVIANINRDRNAAMNVTFVAPLPKSDVSLLSGDVTFPT